MNESLNKYIHFFETLNRGYNKGLGRAPHKPVLLLAIIQLIKKKDILINRIFITPELVLEFKNIWNLTVNTAHVSNFALPFFHMRSEPFWRLATKSGMTVAVTKSKSIKSFKSLKESISFAEIDKELFQLLSETESRNILEQIIIQKYFKHTRLDYTDIEAGIYAETLKIENQILHEDKTEYQNHLKELKGALGDDEYEEELFIRGGLFKKTIPKIYDYSCCISGMKIQSTLGNQMIDACHIIPFSISNDDTIPNGISLSPNLHRAFDRGLITINQDYIVRISPTVTENKTMFSLSQFNGKQIRLPQKANWFPSPESLQWHNREIFAL